MSQLLYQPLAALSAFAYVHNLLRELDVTTPRSFPNFVDNFQDQILQAHKRSVPVVELAQALRVDAQSWLRAESVDGRARRAATRMRLAARAPWYLDGPLSRDTHVNAEIALHFVHRALTVLKPDLNLNGKSGRDLARTVARAARVADPRMLPAIVMAAEHVRIIDEVRGGTDAEVVGVTIIHQLKELRGIPTR